MLSHNLLLCGLYKYLSINVGNSDHCRGYQSKRNWAFIIGCTYFFIIHLTSVTDEYVVAVNTKVIIENQSVTPGPLNLVFLPCFNSWRVIESGDGSQAVVLGGKAIGTVGL